jgi:hypothetical protein
MTITDPDFVQAFSEVVKHGGRWRGYEPSVLVDQWREFVASCVEGFQGDLDEDYMNELTSRSDLEAAMNAPELVDYPQMNVVRNAVSRADEEFRAILIPDAFPKFPQSKWWLRGIVRYSGPKLATALHRAYGITIDSLE